MERIELDSNTIEDWALVLGIDALLLTHITGLSIFLAPALASLVV